MTDRIEVAVIDDVYLADVHIENFRAFRVLDVSFSRGLNVIVGENNVGKTTLLDAIRLALGPASTAGEAVRASREDRHRAADGTVSNEPIRVNLTFRGLSEAEQAEFIDILNYDPTDPEKSSASIHFEWSWPDDASRWHARRYGGMRSNSDGSVPDETLQSPPATMLGALRDALVALSPGRMSRLAQLLRLSSTEEQRTEIETILRETNLQLERNALVTDVEGKIVGGLRRASGPQFSQEAVIRASEPQFDRIVSNLRLVLKSRITTTELPGTLSELRSNGLGFNNLLYIATVLAELDAAKDATLPLLLVEEPEAHLHPQLQTVLADYLASGGTGGDHGSRVQTIVTTHSPSIAAHVSPGMIRVLHHNRGRGTLCTAIDQCGLGDDEMAQLRRMLDVTKATLLFARGVILVEGISEALLVPVLARRMDINLDHQGVSVVPIAGVDFETIAKLFGEDRLRIPLSIVTDGDPPKEYPGDDKSATSAQPKCESGTWAMCDRTRNLVDRFSNNTYARVFTSNVTLEFDLAEASLGNAVEIFDAWKSCYQRGQPSLKRDEVMQAKTERGRALLLWRALCVGDPSHGKAELAQRLGQRLSARDADRSYKVKDFKVPEYLAAAIRHVTRES